MLLYRFSDVLRQAALVCMEVRPRAQPAGPFLVQLLVAEVPLHVERHAHYCQLVMQHEAMLLEYSGVLGRPSHFWKETDER